MEDRSKAKMSEAQDQAVIVDVEEGEPPAQKPARPRWQELVLENLLIIFLIVALIIGIGLGIGLRNTWKAYEKEKIFYLNFPGHLLLGMLKMLILPLIVSSLITALASLDKTVRGKLGIAAIVYYMTTTLIAVIVGIVLVLSIQPGYRNVVTERSGSSRGAQWLPSLLDLIRNCFPDNLVEATFLKQETSIKPHIYNWTENNVSTNVTGSKVSLDNKAGMNVLGVVVFSVALGCVLNHLQEAGRPLQEFFASLFDATMVLVKLVIWYSPIGILFLIAAKFVEMEQDPSVVFAQLGFYFGTVLAGLFLHALIVLPLIYFVATRRNPYRFMYNMLKALCTAWGTASSSATLPITLECLEFRNNVQPQISRFVATVGATINMDGTALYEAVAAIFIAQLNNIDLGIANVIVVSLTATAAAIGAAGVPQAGLVTMAIVLSAVGLPEEDISLILAVDWLLDRFRTAVNVLGDAMGAGILSYIFRDSIRHSIDSRHLGSLSVQSKQERMSGSTAATQDTANTQGPAPDSSPENQTEMNATQNNKNNTSIYMDHSYTNGGFDHNTRL